MMGKRNKFDLKNIVIFTSIFFLMLFSIIPASAEMYLNYTNATGSKFNYSITSNTSRLPSFINLTGGDIEMPSVTLKVYINNVNLTSGNKYLNLTSGNFTPPTYSDIPKHKMYVVSGGSAIVNYSIKAHSAFANYAVNISTYREISNNLPFYSDLSVALLDFDDLKNKWSDDSIVLNELLNATADSNLVTETPRTLNASGDADDLNMSLSAGNYLILVTNGTDPKQIITSTIVKVMPFDSTITVPTTGTIGTDVSVPINLTGAPATSENYTYISSIIKWTDYNDDIGDINISWTSGHTLVESVRINGTPLNNSSSLTDIIPRSYTTRNTTNSTTKTLILSTTSFPEGSYLVHTVVFNSTNQTVAFDQSTITLSAASSGGSSSSSSSSSGSSGGGGSGTSGENYSNILLKEKYELQIFLDKTTIYRFTNTSNPVIYVNITGNANFGAITTSVEVLKGISTLVKIPPPGIIYKNLNIWVGTSGFAVPKNIKTAVIGFKVDNSWIKNNGLSSGDVKLVKWDGSQWVELETRENRINGEFTIFDAMTNSFSPFAIVAKVSGTIPSEATQISQTTSAPTEAPQEVKEPISSSAGSYLLVALGIIIVIIIVVEIYIMKKKKENE